MYDHCLDPRMEGCYLPFLGIHLQDHGTNVQLVPYTLAYCLYATTNSEKVKRVP